MMCFVRWSDDILVRRYIYIVLIALAFLLLINWTSVPRRSGLEYDNEMLRYSHEALTDKNNNGDILQKVDPGDKNLDGVQPEKPKTNVDDITLPKKTKGKTISLVVYMESRCPDTTGFIKRQLVPTFEKLKSVGRINYTIIPFGKAECERKNDDFSCECQHGPIECELNQLMNCAINHLPSASDHVPIIGCVQGESSLDSAFQNCLANHPELEWLKTCATSKRGRYLHALAGERTALLGAEFNFVPWVMIDGKRENDAFYALEENLCNRLDSPKPVQCGYFT